MIKTIIGMVSTLGAVGWLIYILIEMHKATDGMTGIATFVIGGLVFVILLAIGLGCSDDPLKYPYC